MERTLAGLAPDTRWVASRVDFHPELDSTNLRAEALARAGAAEGTLVVADAQTAGRGRLGRAWFSPPGRNLYLSLVLRPAIRADAAHFYVFVGALAVIDTAAALLGSRERLEIKWPNDVLLDGRKLSGVNLPAILDGERVSALVLGIGVNVNLAREDLPPELGTIATSLRIASGRWLDRTAVAEDLLARLERWIETLRDAGPAPILDTYAKWLRMRGSRVRIAGPGIAREVEGIAEGIGEDGALLVRTGGGLERILAGDVELVSKER